MKATIQGFLAILGLTFAAQVAAQATFYENERFTGRSLTATEQVPSFQRYGFNSNTSSAVVVGERWEVCQQGDFNGRCTVLRPGSYPSLAAMGLNDRISSARLLSPNARIDDDRYAPLAAAAVVPQVTFYERERFDGRSFIATGQVVNFQRQGFRDRAASAVVVGERWEVCNDNRFRGACVVLRPGRYPSLAAMGLSGRISSVRAIAPNERIADNRDAPAPVAAQVTFFERESFSGRSFATGEAVVNLQRAGFNERASSAVVVGEPWEVCTDTRFRGNCMVLRPGRYASLAAMGLNDRVSSLRAIDPSDRTADNRYAPIPVAAQVTFFEREGFSGRSFATEEAVVNLQRAGFNERASSAVVVGAPWEVCTDTRSRGNCMVLRPGRYASLAAMGLNDRISSVRAIDPRDHTADNRYAPLPVPVYDNRRRSGERLFDANVTSARAVLATPGQRCWVEREQLPQAQSNANVPAALAGALIGGILGHQVGGGSGKDIATVGGVIAGAALGAQVGRDNPAATQDVQRCENVPGGAQPAFWDVSYSFRGVEHRVQMTSAPGATIVVNDQGEPRQ
ncbi:beta/gamma crystallin-related protein [Hydrogenophaga sp.]|uniref:beta/gamma crystallin-related protein n=1 Tax=Hydrogenophaga sp. TaxID=1904254 RepID=UPI0027172329|nr:beta/gamma crystallin-related protein [Hydrogenophaga sp.]MDO9604138.1 beta/gamma crystallin-related protein [Hydrogenophaga sp.]